MLTRDAGEGSTSISADGLDERVLEQLAAATASITINGTDDRRDPGLDPVVAIISCRFRRRVLRATSGAYLRVYRCAVSRANGLAESPTNQNNGLMQAI